MKNTRMVPLRRIDRGWLMFVTSITVGLVSLVGLIFWGYRFEINTVRSDLTPAINAKLVALNVKPRAVELTSEMAIRVRNAIKQEDYSTADKIAAVVLASSHIENWRFYPFEEFINDIADLNDPAFETHLNAWVALNKNDATPLLIRARYCHDMGWARRGHRFTQKTSTANLEEFRSFMDRALADVEAAIRLDGSNPYSFYLRLKILRGFGLSDKTTNAFDAAIAKDPGYYPLYESMLSMLQPKWGGDVPVMYAFVDRYAGHADGNSPLRLLYLTLYRDLLETASTACNSHWRDNDKMAECATSEMQKSVTPELESNVVRTLQLYDHSDKYQFSVALETLLFDMLKMSGGGSYAGAFLELSAHAMHSDTQLKESKPGHNNYVVDKAVAESWHLKGFHDNALQKDQEALRDIEATSFPSEEERYLAVAGVYQHMGEIYGGLRQYADMIAYEQAATALGNRTEQEYFVCYAYYQLKEYDHAIRACAKAMGDSPGVLQAHYWRGVAYRDKGDADAALRDLTIVADSENDLRTSAAIDISMIYFGRGDNRSALNVLNDHKYLYDPDTSSRQDIAVSYNNRCYAYMQLGELKEALNDCTASLKYGNIPDAFRKQQELVKRLNSHEVAL
jgi:tetratricopeptide (TPR) repeat protein